MDGGVGTAEAPRDIENLGLDDVFEQTIDVERFEAVPEHDGNIQRLVERYGDNPGSCPYIKSMGEAGVQLVQKLAEAEKNPDRGPTIRELMEARKKAAENANAGAEKPKPSNISETTRPTKTEPGTENKPDLIAPSDKAAEFELAKAHSERVGSDTVEPDKPLSQAEPAPAPTAVPAAESQQAVFEPQNEGIFEQMAAHHESIRLAEPDQVLPQADSFNETTYAKSASVDEVSTAVEVATTDMSGQLPREEKPVDAPSKEVVAVQVPEKPIGTSSDEVVAQYDAKPIVAVAVPAEAVATAPPYLPRFEEPAYPAYPEVTAEPGDIVAEIAVGGSVYENADQDDVGSSVDFVAAEIEEASADSVELIAAPGPEYNVAEVENAPEELDLSAEDYPVLTVDTEISLETELPMDTVGLDFEPDVTVGFRKPAVIEMAVVSEVEKPTNPRELQVELSAYIESLEPDKAQPAETALKSLIEVLRIDAEDTGYEPQYTAEEVKEIEHIFVKLLDALNLDYNDDTVKGLMHTLFTPELIGEIVQDHQLSIDQLNNLGTREYKPTSVTSLFTSLMQMIKQKIEPYLMVGKYALSFSVA